MLKLIKDSIPLFFLTIYFSFAVFLEASFAYTSFSEVKMYISANESPNFYLHLINHYYLIIYLILATYLFKNKSLIKHIKETKFENTSDKSSSFANNYFLLILCSSIFFYIKVNTSESYQNIALIPYLYFVGILFSKKILTTALKSYIQLIKSTLFNKSDSKPFNIKNELNVLSKGLVLVSIFASAITMGYWSGMMTKNISYIGNKSLVFSAPKCPSATLKLSPCKDSKQSIISSGNFSALIDYYSEYPPISHQEIYADLSQTLYNYQMLFIDQSWIAKKKDNNIYQVLKKLHEENSSFDLMTLDMYKKSIIEGNPDQFIQNIKQKNFSHNISELIRLFKYL